jgi:transcription initiation factor TFIID subunit 13
VDDFKFLLRNDGKKLARVEELIRMSEDIKAARKIVNMPEFEMLTENTKSGRHVQGGGSGDLFG